MCQGKMLNADYCCNSHYNEKVLYWHFENWDNVLIVSRNAIFDGSTVEYFIIAWVCSENALNSCVRTK